MKQFFLSLLRGMGVASLQTAEAALTDRTTLTNEPAQVRIRKARRTLPQLIEAEQARLAALNSIDRAGKSPTELRNLNRAIQSSESKLAYYQHRLLTAEATPVNEPE